MVLDWRGLGRISEKGEGTKRYKLAVPTHYGDVKYSIGNIVNDIIKLCMVLGLLEG